MKAKDFIKNIIERLQTLAIKFISVKGVGFAIATIALFVGLFDPLMWFFCFVFMVSARMLEKIFVPK